MSRTLVNSMQRDIELFQQFDISNETHPIFFFYTWDAPAISIGKIQRNREQIMRDAEALGVGCYLRPTGGRAVLHGGDICYTFIAAQSDPNFGGTLQESFRKVNQSVISMVNTYLSVIVCGERSVAPRNEETRDYNCFSTHVSNEGLYRGHKIIGAAQAMGSRSFVQQGSIQLNKVNLELESLQSHKTLSELTKQDYDLKALCDHLNSLTRSPELWESYLSEEILDGEELRLSLGS